MKTILQIMLVEVLLVAAPLLQYAQNIGINDNGSSPDPSAMLDVNSISKGMLIPRMTRSQIEAIADPANGLQVQCTTDNTMYIYVASLSIWKAVAYGNGIITPGGGGTCGQPFTDTRDGKIYNTVHIGSQCWMAQNLNIGIMIYGTSNQANNGTIEKYCYDDAETNCDLYGGLYQWDEMMQYLHVGGAQGICPSGWHIPMDAEWTTLTTYLGGEWIAGGKMKSTGTLEEGTGLWNQPNTDATNSSDFSGLPGGVSRFNWTFFDVGYCGYYWSSTENSYIAKSHFLRYSQGYVYVNSFYKQDGFSVRCLRDN